MMTKPVTPSATPLIFFNAFFLLFALCGFGFGFLLFSNGIFHFMGTLKGKISEPEPTSKKKLC